MRELQDRYEGRAVADRLVSNRMRKQFNQADREFIESSSFLKRRLLVQGRRPRLRSGDRRERRGVARL